MHENEVVVGVALFTITHIGNVGASHIDAEVLDRAERNTQRWRELILARSLWVIVVVVNRCAVVGNASAEGEAVCQWILRTEAESPSIVIILGEILVERRELIVEELDVKLLVSFPAGELCIKCEQQTLIELIACTKSESLGHRHLGFEVG